MEIRRQVAKPMEDAEQRVDWFLRSQEPPFEGLPRFKRIDTTDNAQLQELAERKLLLHRKKNKYNNIRTFIEEEIEEAKRYQNWFNKWTEKEQFYPLEHYIDYLENYFIANWSDVPSIERKIKIGVKLIGLNKDHTKSRNSSLSREVRLMHVKDVLKYFNITPNEAIEILYEVKSGYGINLRELVIPEIINYLKVLDANMTSQPLNNSNILNTAGEKLASEIPKIYNGKKIPIKFYALYHWILIESGEEKHFEKDENEKYDRDGIESFAKKRYQLKDGQVFYRAFIDIDITNKTAIAKSFQKNYKEKLITISENDAKIISYLKNWPK